MYAVVGFDSGTYFKEEQYELEFQNFNLTLVPERREVHEGRENPISNQIIIPVTKETEYVAHEAAMMFLSELSWLYGVSIFATEHGGGSVPIRFLTRFRGHRGARVVVDMSYYRPMELGDTQRLALGLYREALGNNSTFFKFLGMFKILEISMTPAQRTKWLTNFLAENWAGFGFRDPYDYVPEGPEELQHFLYKYGRCAVAHADRKPRVDSHSLADYRVLGVCCNVIKDAVEYHMQQDMGIPRLFGY